MSTTPDTTTPDTTPKQHAVAAPDGTRITWYSSGQGPALVAVHGTTSSHTTWDPVRSYLDLHVTLHAMDRRGRGGSGDTLDYDVRREYEDVAAVVDAVAEASGAPVDLLGHSFGGLCAIEAARLTSNVRRLVLYEGWPTTDPTAVGPSEQVLELLACQLEAGDPEAALISFYHDVMSPAQVEAFRSSPVWRDRVRAAHTIPREGLAARDALLDRAEFAQLEAPTLLLVGGATPEDLIDPAAPVAAALPDARVVVLEGQQHIAHHTAPAMFARAVLDFLGHPTGDKEASAGDDDRPAPWLQAPNPGVRVAAQEHVVGPRVLLHDVAGSGDPLVLVPGGLTGWLSWRPHQKRLADHHRAVRVQPIHNELGSAGITGQPGYTAATECESLWLTLDELAIGRVDLVGWSNGAKSALEFAITYPDRVRTLTLVEPPSYWVLTELGLDDSAPRRFVASTYAFANTEVTDHDLAEFLAMAGLAESPAAAQRHPAWRDWLPHRAALSWLTPALMEPPRTLADLAVVTCPVLLTHGTDTAPFETAVVEALGAHLPDARVIELPGDHAHHLQSIDAFLEALESHLHPDPT